MLYISIDPSYTSTGVVYIDLETKFILTETIKPEGRNDSYYDMIYRAKSIISTILSKKHFNNTIVIEEPLIMSQKASSLGILSGIVATTLIDDIDINEIYTIPPNAVSNTNRRVEGYTSKTRKKISQEVAIKYLEVFENHGYKVIIYNDKVNKDGSMRTRKLSTDEADSLILNLLTLIYLKKLPQDLITDLLTINEGLDNDYNINKLKPERKIEIER